MDQIEVIAKQAIEIEELKEESKLFKEIIRKIGLQLFSIGAPLNDNVNGYTDKQLEIFFRIEKLLRGDF